MIGSGDKFSNNRKEKQDIHNRNTSQDDLQLKTDHFRRTLYGLRKYGSENDLKVAAHQKEEFLDKAKVSIEQRAQTIMSRYFRDISKLLADFEQQRVKLLSPEGNSSTVDATPPPQKHLEESSSEASPDKFARDLHETFSSTFDRAFQPAFEQARQKNQSEGDALLQATAHAHQLAYALTFLRAQQLACEEHATSLTQPEAQYLQEAQQELNKQYLNLDDCIKINYDIEYKKEIMQKEIPDAINKCTHSFVRTIIKDYANKLKSYYKHIIDIKEYARVKREYKQLSKGECDQKALIEHIKNTYENIRNNTYSSGQKYSDMHIYRDMPDYVNRQADENRRAYNNMCESLNKITDKYIQRGILRDDAQRIMEETLPRILEENVRRMKDEYPAIISECGITVINFDEFQLLAD